MARNAKSSAVVGSIHLYGTSRTGSGWIVAKGGEYHGDGEPRYETASEALWSAGRELAEWLGDDRGTVEVHVDTPRGPMMAIAPLGRIPSFGSLEWQPVRVYVVSAEEILKHAEPVEA